MLTDVDFLGLRPLDDERFTFTVVNHLARLDGYLYGGTAIAVSIAVAEAVTGRPGVWMTTQFVATAPPGEPVTVTVEVLAPGRRTNQVSVRGCDANGRTMFASLGATGFPREEGLEGEYESRPTVSPPGESREWGGPLASRAELEGIEPTPLPPDLGFSAAIEFREPAVIEHPDPGPGRMCLWVRRRDRQPVTPAVAAFMADMVPLAVSHAAGVVAGGTSLDNTIRLGRFTSVGDVAASSGDAAGGDAEWVLLDLRPHFAAGDYGHGAANIWSEAGRLLAAAGQSSSMFRFDPRRIPWEQRG